jgi:hypothetical protein
MNEHNISWVGESAIRGSNTPWRNVRALTLTEQMSKLVSRPNHRASKDQNRYPNKQTTLMNTELAQPGSTSHNLHLPTSSEQQLNASLFQ